MRTLIKIAAIGSLGIATLALALDSAQAERQAVDPTIAAPSGSGGSHGDFPSFDSVSRGYSEVISNLDGKPGMYTLFVDKKNNKVLAELPRNFGRQNVFVAYTVSGGVGQAGVQTGDLYGRWERIGKRLALIEPNFDTRTTGDSQSRAGHKRVFTDRVILDVPILANGPKGGPVISLSDLFGKSSGNFFGGATAGANTRLMTVEKAKSFPKNVELAFKMPLRGGKFGEIAYSIAEIPENTGYRPRKADERVGYFTTAHMDIGDAASDEPWVRYINRWDVQKADPKLKLSPPKQPIVFYIEHTTPVRYRRWVRDGILEWNKAFEKIGIVNAIEVYQQDEATGAHMDKDPEDARYDFVLWTNSNMGFAIGPSRVHPKTGQILDADIVMDEGFVTSWATTWDKLIPEMAMEGMGPAVLEWLEQNPGWDPRVALADSTDRPAILRELQLRAAKRASGELPGHGETAVSTDLLGDEHLDGLVGRRSQVNGNCRHAAIKALDVAMMRIAPEILMNVDVPKPKAIRKDDPITGTWLGTIVMTGPEGAIPAMEISLVLEMDESNYVSGSVFLGPMGDVQVAGKWDAQAGELTLEPVDEEQASEEPLILKIADGQMTGSMEAEQFSMRIEATREAAVEDAPIEETQLVEATDEAPADAPEAEETLEEELTEEEVVAEADAEEEAPASARAEIKGEQMIDGVPERFIGPMLREVIMHEVGHTLGLRHNFKGSTIYTLEEINSEDHKGIAQSGSVMDYLPTNINFELGETQGDWTTVTLGPYDYWAIEYGYGFGKPEKVLERVNEPLLVYATDEDTSGPDPRARRFDHGKNPLNYAQSQIKLMQHLRSKILTDMVEDGESWAKAREAYEMSLGKQAQAISIASNWIGGSYLSRNKKGDPGEVDPVQPIEAEQQRRALNLVINYSMPDEAYGLTPELLRKMTLDKWYDGGGMRNISRDETFPVHDRIAGMQSVALTQVLNPQTLGRIYDNEFRAKADEDVLTVPETMGMVRDAAWTELGNTPEADCSDRSPYITSLRRNLQRSHLDRLIALSMPGNGFGSASTPVSNLSRMQLRDLQTQIDLVLQRDGRRMDAYSRAHLAEASSLIGRALDAQITTTAGSGGGGRRGRFGHVSE
ncbi:MAG: zinc-dependent metalloprotease [Phycisphaerales bacterium]|nr:zinc-dependent metalloprotease [Phycisphaerales bacterium]